MKYFEKIQNYSLLKFQNLTNIVFKIPFVEIDLWNMCCHIHLWSVIIKVDVFPLV